MSFIKLILCVKMSSAYLRCHHLACTIPMSPHPPNLASPFNGSPIYHFLWLAEIIFSLLDLNFQDMVDSMKLIPTADVAI